MANHPMFMDWKTVLLGYQHSPKQSTDLITFLSKPNGFFFCRYRKIHPKLHMDSKGPEEAKAILKRRIKLETSHVLISYLITEITKQYGTGMKTDILTSSIEKSPGEGNGNPLQYSCLRNPMDRGAWQVTVHGVAKDMN